MKKFSLMLVVVMIVSSITMCLSPVSAEYAADTVAVIGTTEYSSLQDAINAAQGGETIKLIKNVNEGNVIYHVSDTVTLRGEETKRTGTIYLDGNNCSVTSTAGTTDGTYVFEFESNIKIEISNLTINSSWSGIRLMGGAQVKLTNCNIYTSTYNPETGKRATTTDTSGETPVEKELTNQGFIAKIDNDKRSTLEIVSGNYVGYVSTGLDVRQGSMIVRGGNFDFVNCNVGLQVGDGTAQTTPLKAVGYIYGGTFNMKGAYTKGAAILARAYKAGVLVIYGGKFINTNKGSTAKGSAVITSSTSTAVGFTYVLGGEFYQLSDQAKAFINYNPDYNAAKTIALIPNYGRVYAYGGTYYSRALEGKEDTDMVGGSAALTAGTSFLALENTVATMDKASETSKYVVDAETSYDCNVWTANYQVKSATENSVAKVTNTDGSVYFADNLYEAINVFAKEGATVELLKDVELDSTLFCTNRQLNVTIKGAKTISASKELGYLINISSGNYTFDGVTLQNANGSALYLGYQYDAETEFYSAPTNYDVNVTLKNATVTVKEADKAFAYNDNMSVANATIAFTNATVNGTAVTETLQYPVAEKEPEPETTEEPKSTDEPKTTDEPSETKAPDTTKAVEETKAPAETKATEEKKSGCGSSVCGFGLIAIASVAGIMIAKKKEN